MKHDESSANQSSVPLSQLLFFQSSKANLVRNAEDLPRHFLTVSTLRPPPAKGAYSIIAFIFRGGRGVPRSDSAYRNAGRFPRDDDAGDDEGDDDTSHIHAFAAVSSQQTGPRRRGRRRRRR